jgi:hypothetical protein
MWGTFHIQTIAMTLLSTPGVPLPSTCVFTNLGSATYLVVQGFRSLQPLSPSWRSGGGAEVLSSNHLFFLVISTSEII